MINKLGFKSLVGKLALGPGVKAKKRKANLHEVLNIKDSVRLKSRDSKSAAFKKVKDPVVIMPNRRGSKPTVLPFSPERLNDFSGNFFLTENYCLSWDRFGEIRGDKPNLRKIDGVYGLGQPTLRGIRKVIEQEAPNASKITWVNLRAEPVIYLNKYPYSPKSKDNLKDNLKLNTIDPKEVDLLENQLKSEVVDQIKSGEDLICLNDVPGKAEEFVLSPKTLAPQRVKTMSQAFAELAKKYPLEYKRIPKPR